MNRAFYHGCKDCRRHYISDNPVWIIENKLSYSWAVMFPRSKKYFRERCMVRSALTRMKIDGSFGKFQSEDRSSSLSPRIFLDFTHRYEFVRCVLGLAVKKGCVPTIDDTSEQRGRRSGRLHHPQRYRVVQGIFVSAPEAIPSAGQQGHFSKCCWDILTWVRTRRRLPCAR